MKRFAEITFNFSLSDDFFARHTDKKSKMFYIFFLTSIFNHSIHSSIAVFYLRPHSMKNGKGE